MSAAARFKQDDIKRAVAGMQKAGVTVARVEIDTHGNIVLHTAAGEQAHTEPANPWDNDLNP